MYSMRLVQIYISFTQVASKASLPPSHAEALPSGTDATLKTNPRLAVVLLLGIDGAGKTTLLGTLQGEHNPRVRPSVGFKPVTMMLSDRLKVGWVTAEKQLPSTTPKNTPPAPPPRKIEKL